MFVDYRKEPTHEQVLRALSLFEEAFPIGSQVCMKNY